MSGITGICYNKKMNDTSEIKLMSDAISHRGPDGEGFIAINSNTKEITELGSENTPLNLPLLLNFGPNADIYMAHRRLSVIDLSEAGHQPMANKQKDIWLTCNGEIYNYKALKNELSEYEFKSSTDSEVLLYAYEKWGTNCLNRFNGMWAFVIYDAKKNILFGARDRFGIKPLYYTLTNEYFAYNSEIKGLIAKPDVSRKINLDASISYLRSDSDIFDGDTFFKEIFELKPAHYFIYDINKQTLSINKYFELRFTDIWEQYNENKSKEYINGVKDRIFNSIDLRLNADVPIGSCLSGGMDSSALVCSINNLLKEKSYSSIGEKQKVITACYDNSNIDESKWAKIIVDHVSADWYKVYPKKEELFNDLSDLVYTQDIPFGSTSIYAQYRVMQTAKKNGINILFDGQGGDELFTGYAPFYNVLYSEAKKNNDNELLLNEQKYAYNTPFDNIDNTVKKSNLKNILKKYMPMNIKNMIRKLISKPEIVYILKNGKYYKQYNYDTLNQMLYTLMSYTSLPVLLRYADRNSSRFSITTRTPFADDIDLIDYTFNIPSVYKIHNGWSKYLLRESMTGIIPNQIKERTDKIGFATPEYEWLKSIKPLVFENINSDLNYLLNISKMKKDWNKLFASQNKSGTTNIWRYINFILWYKIFKVDI